jgi:hypothetical protein
MTEMMCGGDTGALIVGFSVDCISVSGLGSGEVLICIVLASYSGETF